jgi:hypothetical protein
MKDFHFFLTVLGWIWLNFYWVHPENEHFFSEKPSIDNFCTFRNIRSEIIVRK